MQAMEASRVSTQMAERILNRFTGLIPKWFACIDESFISDEQKVRFKALIRQRIEILQNS